MRLGDFYLVRSRLLVRHSASERAVNSALVLRTSMPNTARTSLSTNQISELMLVALA